MVAPGCLRDRVVWKHAFWEVPILNEDTYQDLQCKQKTWKNNTHSIKQ